MALPVHSGLDPSETAFLCEMESVSIVPRQRLEGLNLLGGPTPPLNPPHRANVPLWLALLLKRQDRANIVPPPWLSVPSLTGILNKETCSGAFSSPPAIPSHVRSSPPFVPSATDDVKSDALPYHWLSLAHFLLEDAADDIPDADSVRRVIRDLRETRMAKLRVGISDLNGAEEARLTGVGGLEVAGERAFIGGVMDGLRIIGASKELSRKTEEANARENGLDAADDDDDDDMGL